MPVVVGSNTKQPPLQQHELQRSRAQQLGPDVLVRHLVPPRMLHPDLQAAAVEMVQSFDVKLAQQLLDELEGNVTRGLVRRSPIRLLRGLVASASRGEYTPDFAPEVAKQRQQKALELEQRKAEAGRRREREGRRSQDNEAIAERMAAIAQLLGLRK